MLAGTGLSKQRGQKRVDPAHHPDTSAQHHEDAERADEDERKSRSCSEARRLRPGRALKGIWPMGLRMLVHAALVRLPLPLSGAARSIGNGRIGDW